MEHFTYQNLLRSLENESLYHHKNAKSCYVINRYVNEYVKEEEVLNFYPKNYLISDKALILYLFMQDKILEISYKEDEYLTVKTYKLSNIKSILLLKNTRRNDSKMYITFDDESQIIFDSEKDTNEYWPKTFSARIIELYHLLLKNPQ